MNARPRLTILASVLLVALVRPALTAAESVTRTISIDKRFLNVPLIKDTDLAKKTLKSVILRIDDEVFGPFRVPLARTSDERYYCFFDLAPYQGKTLRIELVKPGEDDLVPVSLDDEIKDSQDMYREAHRPQFHFTARRGHLNDPNGLIYHDGEYHLYYQHNPLANITAGANKTWGHAVSRDMVHWEEQRPALFPHPVTGSCYSGATFIDQKNQLGRRTGKEDVIVAFYLRTKSGLSLAYSNDRGRTMTDIEQNPVIPLKEEGRIDTPRPFWHEPTGRWVAPLMDYFVDQDGRKRRCVGFYSSENLTTWRFESRVEQDKFGDELTGCVDFFQLPVDGDPLNRKWVMIFIDGSYVVGTFDGKTFLAPSGKPAATTDRIEVVARGNYYATMTFENAPQGRRVQIAWMNSPAFPGMAFNQQLSLPSELTLHSTAQGPRMRMNPARELDSLRAKTHEWKDVVLKAGDNPLSGLTGDLFDVEVEFVAAQGATTEFDLRGHRVTYDSTSRSLTVGSDKPVSRTVEPLDGGVIRLRMLLDRASIEVYGNDGRILFPSVMFPDPANLSLRATCAGGEVRANYLRVHELRSIWK